MEKVEKTLDFSQEGDDIVTPKTSSNSIETVSDQNVEIEKRENQLKGGEAKVSLCNDGPLSKHPQLDALCMKSSETNGTNGPKDGEGSEYSSLKNEVDSRIPRLKREIKNSTIDGKMNIFGQPKSESSSSNSTNFVVPASSNDSYQESAVEARTVNGGNTNNTNSSSMSSTCTDLGYSSIEIKVPNKESGFTTERKPSREKLADALKFIPSKKRSLELAKEESFADTNLKVVSRVNEGHHDVEEKEQSTLSGIDLNEDTTWTNEVEQGNAAFSVKHVRKPIAVFARCGGQSTPEVGFKGLGKGGWKGSASTTSAFRATSLFKAGDLSGDKQVGGIDLNVDAAGVENEIPNWNDTYGKASPMLKKFSIDLNVASENDENFQSSGTVRDFDLNDDLTASDSYVQEGNQLSSGKEAKNDQETYFIRNAGGPEPHYVGPMFLPRLTSVPFVLRVPEQAENASRAFPFHRSACVDPQSPVFSLTSSLNVPLHPAHLNGIPAFHGGPLVEVPNGPGPHNVMKIGPLYNPYNGMNPLENASLEGSGMQVFTTPMHPMIGQQLNDFRRGGLPSLTPMKRREPEVRWGSH
ncbi:uncharacterized protein LOC116204933 [Punica granatum]|uniref:Uncharacterized protein LOC116204933 n=1 Tax=Punica granatum TaxID=22663 RepID=A0A218XJK0_PUNGR|nr:uncharacterized protein LOC116204933 [Punica granatum]XP_031393172.1 uncharacterized protein LOC116204933 [Punica granatum]OWM85084.1 hypothetical protein CDL15_Pgr027871 [Punica granatum]